MKTKEDVWLAVYQQTLTAQRAEHPMMPEEEWALEAGKEADMAVERFQERFSESKAG